jgi:hypothetical protein
MYWKKKRQKEAATAIAAEEWGDHLRIAKYSSYS